MSVEQTCYKCQALIPQGKVFCPECRAPLIRVTVPEAALYPAQVLDTGIPSAIPSHAATKTSSPGKVEWIYGLPAASLAGVIAAVLMIASWGTFAIGTLATGILAVVLYRRRDPDSNITLGMGMKLGLVSGLIGFLISTVFVATITLFTGTERLRTFLLEMTKQAPRYGPAAQQNFEKLMKPEGFPSLLLTYASALLLVFLIFSSIGGTLGAIWMRFRRRS